MKSNRSTSRKAAARPAPKPLRRGAPKDRPARPARRPARRPAATAGNRVRELEAQVRRLKEELALAQAPAAEVPGEGALAAGAFPGRGEGDAVLPDGGKRPVARSHEGELPFEEFDDESDLPPVRQNLRHRRGELDRERAERETELGDESYWWVCPKCGDHLSEHEFDNIKAERCESCGAVSLDRGEIELLLEFSEEDRILAFRARGLMQ